MTSSLAHLPQPLPLPVALHSLLRSQLVAARMQSRQNVVDFPSGFQEFASYQDPEEAAPAPAANPWEEMEPNGYGWDTHTPVDSHIEPTVPFFIEVPQVPQIPTLYAPPESSLPHPDQQLVSLPKLGC